MSRSLVYSRFIQTGALRSIKVGAARRGCVTDLLEFVRELREQAERDGA